MRLSTKSRYGLRILIQIAIDNLNGKKLAQGRVIAKKQDITDAYLEQIMIPLKRGGVVGTVRGCNGGYELQKECKDITVLEVIELFEGRVNLADCSKGNIKCKMSDKCSTTDVWKKLSESFRAEAGKVTLASIVEDYLNNNSNDYVI
jgi:Rrf2 family transcriptional regulator, cysteine metabolism repressor